jgi:hypothetical protein
MSERRKGWGRGPEAEHKQPVEDITENAFERNRKAIAARNAAVASAAIDSKKIKDDAQKHFDATHRQTPSRSAVMDPSLAAASKNYHADRLARRSRGTLQVPAPVSLHAIKAMIEYWLKHGDSARSFFESTFNYTSLINATITLMFGRGRPVSPETVAEAYFVCADGNYLELPRVVDANGATIRKRGFQSQPVPPTLFAKFVWPQEEAAVREAELQEAFTIMLGTNARRKAEDAANRKVPLAEMQKQVRAGYKPDALPADLIGSKVL